MRLLLVEDDPMIGASVQSGLDEGVEDEGHAGLLHGQRARPGAGLTATGADPPLRLDVSG